MKSHSFILGLSLFLVSLSLSAQPAPPGGGSQPAPLGGIALLAAAGAALGVKKAYDKKKES